MNNKFIILTVLILVMPIISTLSLIISIAFLFVFFSPGEMSGMPKYESKECYYGKGFQDYTHYCKYYYSDSDEEKFANHSKFKKLLVSDFEEIEEYFESFEMRVGWEEYYEEYDFIPTSQIKEGNYFYIYEKEGYDKFQYYDIYYFDVDKNILYFFHSNT